VKTTSEALSDGTGSQGISQFYLPTPTRSSAIGMIHTCLAFPAIASTQTDERLSWPGWLVT